MRGETRGEECKVKRFVQAQVNSGSNYDSLDDDADLVPIKKRRLDRIDQNKDSKQIEGFKEQVAYFEKNRSRWKRPDALSFYVNKVVRTAAKEIRRICWNMSFTMMGMERLLSFGPQIDTELKS